VAVMLDNLGLLYLASPGTGSTALLSYLEKFPTARQVPRDPVEDKNGKVVVVLKHCKLAELKQYAGDQIEGAQYVVTSTRNPFDFWYAAWHRSRTKWYNGLKNPDSWVYRQGEQRLKSITASKSMDFSEWIIWKTQEMYKNGEQIALHHKFLLGATHVVRMEHMQEDLETALRDIGFKGEIAEVPQKNKNKGRNDEYWRFYNAEARKRIEFCYAPSLERFGYVF
jgi:hypothetical protein